MKLIHYILTLKYYVFFQVQAQYNFGSMNFELAQGESTVLTLGEIYKINRIKENELGKGGFGVVWRGQDTSSKNYVAVKEVVEKDETKEFIKRELRFMSACKHPNIVKLIDHKKYKSRHYFVMEYFRHRDLNHYAKDRIITFPMCMRFMKDISSAVKYLHEMNIFHRDIKPRNILVEADEPNDSFLVKLADMGLARDLPNTSSTASATGKTGTEGWMAPEIPTERTRAKYGLPVDIFSMGLIFIVLLYHEPGNDLNAPMGM